MDCLFCKIDKGEIPAKIFYRDDKVLAFADVNPQAPHHVLVIPHQHISTLNDMQDEDAALVGHMVQTATKLAKELGISDEGYRVNLNCNKNGGQTVFHIHLHLLGGRRFSWPPG